MSERDQRERFVFSGGGPLEGAIAEGVALGFSRVDFNADGPPNYPATFYRRWKDA